MLSKHHAVITQLSAADQRVLRTRLGLDPLLSLIDALDARGHDQADIVLTLLHAGHHDAVKLLMGRAIIVFAAQRSPIERQMEYERAQARPAELGDLRRIRVSVPTCPLKIPSAKDRWHLMQSCRTVQAYISRVPRWRALRDLREWAAAGWLQLDGAS